MPKAISKQSSKTQKNFVKAPRYRLIDLRTNTFVTQQAAADDFGMSNTHWRNLEKGRVDPSTDMLFKIAHRFGVDVYDCWPDIAGSRPQ